MCLYTEIQTKPILNVFRLLRSYINSEKPDRLLEMIQVQVQKRKWRMQNVCQERSR